MRLSSLLKILLATLVAGFAPALAQEELPFPTPPMGGKAGPTMQESVHKWRVEESHLPTDAPNVLIVMLDDCGFGHPSTFGGDISTPTLSRLAQEGISYNRFHTTAMCSPTRASLMTGRNHHRVGAGQIAEFANDWDGYTGVIPKSSATVAEVLGYYGYAAAAFGKDHNTPVDQIANGPYDRTPTGRGFDYFYGFIAGETSQWEPVLWENTTPVSTPHVENHEDFHLTEAMAGKAITWMRRHRAIHPDRPFLMWWTPGAVHGPHRVAQKWANKYEGQFNEGWDSYQKRVFERQKKMGWIPADAKRAPRPEGMPAWDTLSAKEKAFQARLMEVYAGFLEHTDVQVGKLIDELDALGIRDNPQGPALLTARLDGSRSLLLVHPGHFYAGSLRQFFREADSIAREFRPVEPARRSVVGIPLLPEDLPGRWVERGSFKAPSTAVQPVLRRAARTPLTPIESELMGRPFQARVEGHPYRFLIFEPTHQTPQEGSKEI